jgi:hypothetical protein
VLEVVEHDLPDWTRIEALLFRPGRDLRPGHSKSVFQQPPGVLLGGRALCPCLGGKNRLPFVG